MLESANPHMEYAFLNGFCITEKMISGVKKKTAVKLNSAVSVIFYKGKALI
jgi:hypothetical protein